MLPAESAGAGGPCVGSARDGATSVTFGDGVTAITYSFIAYTRGAGAVSGRGRLRVPASAHPSRRRRETSLAGRLLALQGLMVGAVVLTSTIVAYREAQEAVRASAEQEATAIVASLADSPLVLDAVTGDDPTAVLQPYVEEIRADTGTSFITVLAPTAPGTPTRTRARSDGRSAARSHPLSPGRRSPRPTPAPWGPRCGATGPVLDPGGEVAGVGGRHGRRHRRGSGGGARHRRDGRAAMAVGGLGSWALSRRVCRQTHGLVAGRPGADGGVPRGRAVRRVKALLLVDGEQRVQLANDEARRLLDLDGDPAAASANLPPAELTETLCLQGTVVDEIHVTGTRVLVLNQAAARPSDRAAGTVVTLRDHTELQTLTGELDSVRPSPVAARAVPRAANRPPPSCWWNWGGCRRRWTSPPRSWHRPSG